MADDNIDFRFLGQQVKNLQGDVRDLKADHQRLESSVAAMRSDITRLDGRLDRVEERLDRVEGRLDRLELKVDVGFRALDEKIENHHRANQTQFDQHARQAATNMQILLAAIGKSEGSAAS